MRLLESFTKHPSESYTKGINYAGLLPAGAAIASVSATATDTMTGADASATVLGSPSFSGDEALIPVQAGTDGRDYLITFLLTLDNSNVVADQILMQVRRTDILGA